VHATNNQIKQKSQTKMLSHKTHQNTFFTIFVWNSEICKICLDTSTRRRSNARHNRRLVDQIRLYFPVCPPIQRSSNINNNQKHKDYFYHPTILKQLEIHSEGSMGDAINFTKRKKRPNITRHLIFHKTYHMITTSSCSIIKFNCQWCTSDNC
jgi:hypothetical protein